VLNFAISYAENGGRLHAGRENDGPNGKA